eukprot:629343-Ditylum_brightwellii.AAC.1
MSFQVRYAIELLSVDVTYHTDDHPGQRIYILYSFLIMALQIIFLITLVLASCSFMVNIIKQVITHDEDSCILLSNSNIKDKGNREAVKQHNTKHPPQDNQRKSTDIPRKSP